MAVAVNLQPGMKGAIWLFGFGALAAAVGALALIEQFHFEHGGVQTSARVVEHRSRTVVDKHDRPHEEPVDVYELTTTDNAMVRFEETKNAHVPIGESAVVYYPAAHPERARLAGSSTGIGCGALIFGALFLWMGRIHLRVTRNQPPTPSIKNRQKAARRSLRKRPKRGRARG